MEKNSVVVCDDNTILLFLLKQIFGKRGFSVWTACSGEQGLSLVLALRPDFLLLDLEMPGFDGLSVLEELKTLEGKRPYVIVVSAYDGPERRRRATALGAQEIWSKPFNALELTSRIQSLIEASNPPADAKAPLARAQP